MTVVCVHFNLFGDHVPKDRYRRVAAAARAFDQGAIYEYTLTQGAVARRTLGVGMAMDETTFMRRMPYDELLARRPDLVGLPWAGPSDGGVLP